MDTIEVPVEVLETLVALSGTGQYGTPHQRRLLSDAVDLLNDRAIQAASNHPDQLTLFDATVYERA